MEYLYVPIVDMCYLKSIGQQVADLDDLSTRPDKQKSGRPIY